MGRGRNLVRAAAWLAALLVLVGACGGDDGVGVDVVDDGYAGRPVLSLNPVGVKLSPAAVGQTDAAEVEVRNIGSAPLVVSGLRLVSESPDFRATFAGETVGATYDPPMITPLQVTLAAGTALPLRIAYTATRDGDALATLTLFSNDAEHGQVDLEVFARVPPFEPGVCLKVLPASVDFGGCLVDVVESIDVAITNCSSVQPLELTYVELKGATDGCTGPFCLIPHDAVPVLDGHQPLTLAPGEHRRVTVTYHPRAASPLGDDDQPLPSQAILAVTTSADPEPRLVPVRGFAVSPFDCPVAVIEVPGPSPLPLGQGVTVSGAASSSPYGAIVAWEWSVQGPPGALVHFDGSSSVPERVLQAETPGTYTLALRVRDEFGRTCTPATATVIVAPVEGLYVLLAWFAPGDPNPYDGGPKAGPDLDLHLAHPAAAGPDRDGDGQPDPWFDAAYDLYDVTDGQDGLPPADWDAPGPADDPVLWRASAFGLGPEAIAIDQPTAGASYRVGVSFHDDNGYGSVFATVSLFADGVLAYEAKNVYLQSHDLWWIGEVAFPAGEVTPWGDAEGGPRITHDYGPADLYEP